MRWKPSGLSVLVLASALLALGAESAPPAAAAFGPIELISKGPREQSDFAVEPAISADGHYVAYCGKLGGHEGIFRVQLETGQVEPVAVGPPQGRCERGFGYASAPSISADGRYVSFTTNASLVGTDTVPGSSDVYVADMSASPPTYELASTVDGSTPMEGGSLAAGQVALSADGTRIAFVNRGNVYVRDLVARETILISAVRDPATGMTSEPVSGGGAYEPAGAAISADGSTVAWVGEHLPRQVPLLSDEAAAIEELEAGSRQYHEPLWRRVPAPSGEVTPTRRIVGGGDPLAPGCPPSGTLQTPACQGPFPQVSSRKRLEFVEIASGFGWGVKLPHLDANGNVVALVGNPEEQYDLFVVDMAEGLDRVQAVNRITRWTNPVPQEQASVEEVVRGTTTSKYLPFTGAVTGCAISADGTRVAFTTTRQHFGVAPFTLATEIPTAVSLISELYEVNLENDRIERATPPPGQSVSESGPHSESPGASAPSIGGEGDRMVAFSSGAANLVAGDSNESTDAFVVESLPSSPIGSTTISPRPPQTVLSIPWRITANAYSRPDGSVRVVARVPGQGTLRAEARSQVGPRLKTDQVASGRRGAQIPQTVIVNLKLGPQRRSLARQPGGLVTRVAVSFVGPGGQPLHADLQSRFFVHQQRRKRHGKAAGH
jgi:hypothetical protein